MRQKRPLISIALCTYNGERYIQEQLVSILKQSYKNIEVIILDDCSIDRTYTLLEEFRLADPRIKLFRNEKNIGYNQNFSKALTLAGGEYIAIADQDDIWEKEKIELLLHGIGDNLLFYHDSVLIDEEGRLIGKKISDLHRFVKGNCSDLLLYHNCVSGHASFFHKDLLTYCLPLPEGFYYDWWIAYTASCTGKINFTRQALVFHRRHVHSATGKDCSRVTRKYRIEILNHFNQYPHTPPATKKFLGRLLEGYAELQEKKFSFKLFFFLLVNARKLFFTRKKSIFSMIKFGIKESSG